MCKIDFVFVLCWVFFHCICRGGGEGEKDRKVENEGFLTRGV